jgi:predicted metalloprotease
MVPSVLLLGSVIWLVAALATPAGAGANRATAEDELAQAVDPAALQPSPAGADAALLEEALQGGDVGSYLTAAQVTGLTKAVADDLDTYWGRAFTAEGRYYDRPDIVLIEGMTPTPCAWAGAVEPGSGSFYCPWNQTIYLDVAAIQVEAARYGAAGLLFTLAHEWGHHAQFQRGALQERSQAVELAADCLAGAYLADAVGRGWIAAEVVSDDVRGIVATLGDPLGFSSTDSQAHGTGEQRTAMLLAGYLGGAAACGRPPTTDS